MPSHNMGSCLLQAKADAKQEVIQAKKAEQAALRAARTADARQREEAARLRLEQKVCTS